MIEGGAIRPFKYLHSWIRATPPSSWHLWAEAIRSISTPGIRIFRPPRPVLWSNTRAEFHKPTMRISEAQVVEKGGLLLCAAPYVRIRKNGQDQVEREQYRSAVNQHLTW